MQVMPHSLVFSVQALFRFHQVLGQSVVHHPFRRFCFVEHAGVGDQIDFKIGLVGVQVAHANVHEDLQRLLDQASIDGLPFSFFLDHRQYGIPCVPGHGRVDQISKAEGTHVFQGSISVPGDVVSIQVVEEPGEQPHHGLVVAPSPAQLSQHGFSVFFLQRGHHALLQVGLEHATVFFVQRSRVIVRWFLRAHVVHRAANGPFSGQPLFSSFDHGIVFHAFHVSFTRCLSSTHV
mmetsp:Transcript_7717/g.47815  ORF Transcript_7717/g.47815 Transcript_7717/m.47815 type:complete len:234 (-) Transcript_7717:279-980(-)